jgi:hypothetical protein
VGRDAIDAEAMRLLEAHNPDVSFDWDRLLKAGSAAAAGSPGSGFSASEFPGSAGPAGSSASRDERRRERRERRGRPESPRTSGRQPRDMPPTRYSTDASSIAAPTGFSDAPDTFGEAGRDQRADRPAWNGERPGDEAANLDETDRDRAGLEAGHRASRPRSSQQPEPQTRNPESPDVLAGSDEAGAAGAETPVEPRFARVGAHGVARLRARYADLKTRLLARDMDEADRGVALQYLERLNPDAWPTQQDVDRALEEYEAIFEALRPLVGRQPRRPS